MPERRGAEDRGESRNECEDVHGDDGREQRRAEYGRSKDATEMGDFSGCASFCLEVSSAGIRTWLLRAATGNSPSESTVPVLSPVFASRMKVFVSASFFLVRSESVTRSPCNRPNISCCHSSSLRRYPGNEDNLP